MENSGDQGIFLVRRRSGEYLILHPFRPGGELFRDPDRIRLEGRYATEPGSGESEALRQALHAELERGMRKDALDRGFYPRLIISAAVFLVLYLFLSIVVRDPVPLVDELLAGGLGAFACWFALERRALSSESFAQKAAVLRRTLDSAIFRPSRTAQYLEEVLQDAETLDPERFAEFSDAVGEMEFSDEEMRELAELADALEYRLPGGTVEDARAALTRKGDLPRLARRMASRNRKDLPILLSYIRMKTIIGASR